MAIPKYQEMLTPIMQLSLDTNEFSLKFLIQFLADLYHLTQEERELKIPKRQNLVFNNRVGWACTYLKKTGFLSTPRRGWYCITERGKNYMTNFKEVMLDKLKEIDEFKEFITPRYLSGLKKIV